MFLVFYGAGLAAGQIWLPLESFEETFLLAAIGVACAVNFRVNRTLHCGIAGPLFLTGAGVVAMAQAGLWRVNGTLIWAVLLAGVGAAALLEWRVTSRSQGSDTDSQVKWLG